jgi:hypothetical protein
VGSNSARTEAAAISATSSRRLSAVLKFFLLFRGPSPRDRLVEAPPADHYRHLLEIET